MVVAARRVVALEPPHRLALVFVPRDKHRRRLAQMGFTRCVLRSGNVGGGFEGVSCELVGVQTVAEALDALCP